MLPVAPGPRQGVLTMLSKALGEFPEAAQELPAASGSFDCVTASLREAVTSLWKTWRAGGREGEAHPDDADSTRTRQGVLTMLSKAL